MFSASGGPIEVISSLYFRNIESVDIKNQDFTVDVTFRFVLLYDLSKGYKVTFLHAYKITRYQGAKSDFDRVKR